VAALEKMSLPAQMTVPLLTPRSEAAVSEGYCEGSRRAVTASATAPAGTQSRGNRSESSIQVVVRFRPPVTDEELQDKVAFVVHPSERCVHAADGSYHFELDRAFPESATQEAVYDHVGRPVVEDVLSGYNGTIFAYGQTGSGKTHCMFGPGVNSGSPEAQGIVPRAVRQLFDFIEVEHLCGLPQEVGENSGSEFTLYCSFLEVYREQMRDLLNPMNTNLRIKELPQRGLFVDGLTQLYVTCASEVMHALRAGKRARAVGSTRLNQHSSRSHAVFALHVEQLSASGTKRLGKLSLVDLAGSEKVSKSESVGETLEEAKKINWSLSALGNVIDALAEQRPHVPYRDSRLTRVLEEALGGNCHTTLLVAASTCMQHFDETLSSLRFATRAKYVRNHAKVNYMYSSDQLLLLVAQLQRDLASAKQRIAHLTGIKQSLPQKNALPAEWQSTQRDRDKSPEDSKRRRKPLMRSNSLLSFRKKLGSSGSAPALGIGKLLSSDDSSDTDRRRSSAWSHGGLNDIDEISPLSPVPFELLENSTPVGTPRSDSSDTLRGVGAAKPPHGGDALEDMGWINPSNDEGWRPLALAARDTLRSLEAALLAQEHTLKEALHLNSQLASCSSDAHTLTGTADTGQSDARHPSAVTTSDPKACSSSSIADKFQALRSAVDARSLHWRLQLERHRSDGLSLELDMRKRYAEELERSLEETNTRLASLLNDVSPNNEKSTRTLNCALQRLQPSRRWRASCTAPGTATASSSASQPSHRLRKAKTATAPLVSSRTLHLINGEHGGWSGDFSAADSSSEQSAAPDPMFGARSSDDIPPVAGTGDTGESSMASTDHRARAALNRSRVELSGQVERLQGNLAQREAQILEVYSELALRDVRISALRHEVHVKNALLGHLCDENLERLQRGDVEVEGLLEKAMASLYAVLARERAVTVAKGLQQSAMHR